MTTNTTKKVAEASNFNDPHTDTNGVDFPTDDTQSKAIALPLVPSPDKAAVLTALTKLIDPPDVLSVQSLTTKKRIKAAMGGTAK